jgi:hypothetical protein
MSPTSLIKLLDAGLNCLFQSKVLLIVLAKEHGVADYDDAPDGIDSLADPFLPAVPGSREFPCPFQSTVRESLKA